MATATSPDEPYALAEVAERVRRNTLLRAPHMAPLTAYVEMLRRARGQLHDPPHFDPCDGGTNARVLFLQQDPGPKAVESGFISRNNPDGTARNMCTLQSAAGIARTATVLWNIVPWRVGDVTKQDLNAALPYLGRLCTVLAQLEVVVLVGKAAQSAHAAVRAATDAPLLAMPHPSPRNLNGRPEQRREIERVLQLVSAGLTAPCAARRDR